jgi:hypothetical protein
MALRGLLLTLLICLGSASWAESACEVEPSLDKLLDSISHYDPYKGQERMNLAEIRKAYNGLSSGALQEWLARPERRGLKPEVEGLMKAVVEAMGAQTPESLMVMQSFVRRFDVRYAAICGVPSNAVASSSEVIPGQLNTQNATAHPKDDEPKKWKPKEQVEEETDFSLLILGVSIMAALAVLWWIGHQAARWGKALFYRRQGCRVSADLFIDKDLVEGFIVVLGRKGCMFETLDRWAHEKVERLAGTGKTWLRIDDTEITCKITRIDDFGAGIKFDQGIKVSVQRALLKRSTTTPFLIHALPSQTLGNLPIHKKLLVRLGLGFLLQGGGSDSDGLKSGARSTEVPEPMQTPGAAKSALSSSGLAQSLDGSEDEEEALGALEESEEDLDQELEEELEEEMQDLDDLEDPWEAGVAIGRPADGIEDVFSEEELKTPPMFVRTRIRNDQDEDVPELPVDPEEAPRPSPGTE